MCLFDGKIVLKMGNCNGVNTPNNKFPNDGLRIKPNPSIPKVNADIEQQQELFKIVLAGNSTVGKSCFTSRVSRNEFNLESRATIGVEFATRSYTIDTKTGPVDVKIQLWDTAGQDRYRAITSSYYRGASAVIAIYSITDQESLNGIQRWITEVNQHTDNVLVILVGNKSDSEYKRQVNKQDAEDLARQINCKHFEVSAMTGDNCNDVILYAARQLLINKRKAERIKNQKR